MKKANILVWAGLRHAIPSYLKWYNYDENCICLI